MIEEVFKNYTIKLGRNQDENDELVRNAQMIIGYMYQTTHLHTVLL